MKTKLLTLVIFFLLIVPVFAQSVDTAWVRRYNGPGDSLDGARAIGVDVSGNVYVTGGSWGGGTDYDYTTIKYYANGDTAWVRRYNGPGDSADSAHAIKVDNSSNVYVTGESWGSGTYYDYATIKYHLNGDTAWVRRYNGPGNSYDHAYAMVVDSSGNVYVTGGSYGSGTSVDYATIKYHPNGDTAWVRRYNGPTNCIDRALAIAVDNSGNVYVTGESDGDETSWVDYATIKYDPNGIELWVRRYNGPGNYNDYARSVAADDSGNVYVTGSSDRSTWPDNFDYATIKYHPNGDTAWVRTYHGTYNGPENSADVPHDIAVDDSGNVYVTGRSRGSGTNDEYATIKYHSNGDTAWVRRYTTGSDDNWAYDLALDGFDNVYVTGGSFTGGSCGYMTIKYYANGDTAWVRISGGSGGYAMAFAVSVDDFSNVYVTGESWGSGANLDYATIKYIQYHYGDTNKDGVVDVGDVVYLINYLFKNGSAPNPPQAGDANCDGNADVGDVVYLINYLFKSGPAPSC